MRKHPFVIFLVAIAVLITSAVAFIQSPAFADILKGFVAKHLPSDLGVQANFSDLSIGLFPPSVSIRNPKVEVSEQNLISLPPGATVTAKRIDLRFRLFQMFGGNIRINEVAVVDGDVNLVLHTPPPDTKKNGKSKLTGINWDELFQIRAEAVGLENTVVHVRFADSPFTADLTAEQLRLAQWKGKGGIGYELRADLKDLNSSVLKDWVPESVISRLSAIAHVNAAGMQIDDLSTILEGVDIHLSGEIQGNVLNAKALPFQVRLGLRADLATANRFLAEKRRIDAQGSVEVDAKLRGNLMALQETLKADGQIVGDHVRYERWVADHVAIESAYVATGAGQKGEITLGKALIESKEVARVGGRQPGSGGKLEIGSFKYVIGSRDPVTVPLKMERAHLHWLGAGAMKQVYPMDTRISGSLNATFVPPKDKLPWSLQAGVDLALEEFQLDNQRFGFDKPMKRIFRLKNVKVVGPLSLNSGGISTTGLSVSMPHTHLAVTGSVTGKDGFNILGQGPASLGEVGEIAEAPVTGDGNLRVHVHGPTSRTLIDFDADMQGAEYLRMKLGTLSGRITWDDDPDYLIFDHVHATKGQTSYEVNGKLDLGKADTINLSVAIPSGNVLDLTGIFENFTHDFWWFPQSISGPVSGSAKVTGGVSWPQMVITAELNGNNWQYLGERARIVNIKGGYDRGKYQLTDIHGVKETGKYAGRISYDAERRFDWDFKTQDFLVTDINHLARLDVPFRGKIHFDSRGTGPEETLQSLTQASVTDLSVRGQGYGPSTLQLKTEKGFAQGLGTVFGDQESFDFSYGMKPGLPSSLRFEGKHFDFSPAVLLLNPKMMQDAALQAYLTGSLKLNFLSGEIEKASGSMFVGAYELSKTGTEFKLSHPETVKFTEGNFSVHELSLVGPSNSVTLSVHGKPSSLEGSVTGGLDLGLLEFVTPTIAKASGSADLDFTIDGTLKAPKIFGTADIDGGTLRIPALDSPFENATGTITLRENVVTVQNLESDLGGGRVRMGGTITLFSDRFPTLALKGDLSGNRIRVYPFQYVKLKGTLGVNGEERPYLVDGNLTVDSAMSKEKILGAKQEQGLRSMQYTPASTAQGDQDQALFKLKIDVTADHGIMVQNDLFFDTEVKAKVTLVNTLEAPRIIGTADLIQGKMKFKDRIFQIQSANAVFDNPNVINPQFNLTATADVSNTKIQIYASGRLPDRWKLDLTSNPAMAESEILSLLAIGNTSASANQRLTNTAVDNSAAQQGQAASLLLQSLDFNREVQEKTGFEFQFDEYENNLLGQSLFSRTMNETTVSPKIVVRRRLGDKVTVSYGSTVGVDTNKQTEANVELHVTQGFSVIGVWDSYEFNDLQQKLDSESSYGFDFKLQKRFK